ncbi:hypothetical protein PISL3812_09950 [Talaromyces islandicus]|uniref:Uncharacterized protein n=1 Tax=Talaromyces islandicus TaxID=28573 RepID=A0A0U1MBE5_TALIS|nr:hypothetical protein PISL3812_09950 [Talaromyces islandicus]
MAPSTARSTRSSNNKVLQPTASKVNKNSTKAQNSNDKKAVLDKEIKEVKKKIENSKGKEDDVQAWKIILEARKKEREALDEADQQASAEELDMDMDSPTDEESHSLDEPNPVPGSSSRESRQENGAPTATGNSQTDTGRVLVRQEVDELTDQMRRADIAHDPLQEDEAWRGGQGKLVTVRIGPADQCKYEVQTRSRDYDTSTLQQVSKRLNFLNAEHDEAYGLGNIFGYSGIVVYGNGKCDLKVQWRDLQQGVPKSLVMMDGCSWVTRTELLRYFKKVGKTEKHLWDKMKQTWDEQEKRYAGYTQYYTPVPFPIPKPAPSPRKNRGRRSTRRGSSGKSHVVDSGYESDTPKSGARRQDATSQSDTHGSPDSLFVSQTSRPAPEPEAAKTTFSEDEYVDAMLRRLKKEQDDVEAVAKIVAAYHVYKAEMLKNGAVERTNEDGEKADREGEGDKGD